MKSHLKVSLSLSLSVFTTQGSPNQAKWGKSRPISAEVALPQLQSEIKVALFLFASHSFLANNLRFMVKLIVKTNEINGKIYKNKRKRFYSSNKEGLIC